MSDIDLKDIIKPENLVYQKAKLMTDTPLSYCPGCGHGTTHRLRSEEHTSELQSHSFISYAVFCLKKKKK